MPVRRNDLDVYDRCAAEWWDARATTFRSLHRVNTFRLEQLRAWIGDPRGASVVDLGCGGGLLAEPLARAGARVIGIDRSQASLRVARAHAGAGLGVAYVRGDLLAVPLASACADLVLLADVLEHVAGWQGAVAEAARLLHAGGRVYVNTIRRGLLARLLAVTLAEGLRLVPRGTHDPALFVAPDELREVAAAHGLRCVRLQGEAPRLLRTLRQRAIELRPSRRIVAAYAALLERV